MTRDPSLGKLWVQRIRPIDLLLRPLRPHSLLLDEERHPDISIGELRMRQRVIGIGRNRSLEIVNGRFHLRFSTFAKAALVEAMDTPHIIFMSDWVRRGTLNETRLLRRVESQLKASSHLLRHPVLNREDVGTAHIKAFSPQRRPVAGAQQTNAHT